MTFCFSEMPNARQPWPYLCSLCLPRSLGSAAAYTDYFLRNAHCISLFLSDRSASDNLIPSLSRLRLTVSSRLQAQGFISGAILVLLSLASLVCSPCPPSGISSCRSLRCVCVLRREFFVELQLFK